MDPVDLYGGKPRERRGPRRAEDHNDVRDMPPGDLLVGTSGHCGAADLLPDVERLDLLIQRSIHRLDRDDRLALESLMLPPAAVEARLWRPTGSPPWLGGCGDPVPPAPVARGRLARLISNFGLSSIERDLVVLGLLPRLDLRYAALFEYLSPQSARAWPRLDLALQLLCSSRAEALAQRSCLGPQSALFKYRLLAGAAASAADQVAPIVRTEIPVFHYLIGGEALTPAPCTDWLRAGDGAGGGQGLDTEHSALNAALAQVWAAATMGPIMLLRGEIGGGRGATLAAAAARQQRRALRLDLAVLPEAEDEALGQLADTLREARMWDACLLLDAVDALAEARPRLFAALVRLITEHPQPLASIVSPHAPLIWLGSRAHVLYEMPKRRREDDVALLSQQLALKFGPPGHDTLQLDALLRRFKPSPESMTPLLEEADVYRQQRAADAPFDIDDLRHALILRSQRNFGKLAQRLTPTRSFADLMLAEDVEQQVREVMAALRHREAVLELGFDRKLGVGTGISALFHGESGTGKTMAAEVLAEALGIDMIKIDLSAVVNKFVGETEKHLARIFDLAASDGGLLFFDEADALFGKRAETRDAQDRHANIEVAYLLQRLESHPGLVVLSTNHRAHLDDAFMRRLTFMIRFTFPDAKVRERMWRAVWPDRISLAEDVDLAALAARAEIAGGGIRNIALLATWLARQAGAPCVARAHIERALQRELGKSGRVWAAG